MKALVRNEEEFLALDIDRFKEPPSSYPCVVVSRWIDPEYKPQFLVVVEIVYLSDFE